MKTGVSGKKALVVVDMLNDFVRPGAPLEVPETRAILPALRRRIWKARRDGELVAGRDEIQRGLLGGGDHRRGAFLPGRRTTRTPSTRSI